MSQSKFIEYNDRGFWAYDVALGIFLKYLIDEVEAYEEPWEQHWLPDAIYRWRCAAALSDIGLTIPWYWTEGQREVFGELVTRACCRLEERREITAAEAASWDVLDGMGIDSRGVSAVWVEPVVELGEAMKLLVAGKLPRPPEGEIWFYGAPPGRRTIGWSGPPM